MRVRGGAKDELDENQKPEGSHWKKQRISFDLDLAINPLLREPEQSQGGGASLQNKNRPRFDCAKGERPKHQQAKRSVKQYGAEARGSGPVIKFLSLGYGHETVLPRLVYKRFRDRWKSSTQSLPRIGLPSGRRRMCRIKSLQSALVVSSPFADFQNPASLSSSLS